MSFDFTLIGLTNRDRRVYEALFANPDSSMRSLADLTGINRGSVHESIKDLVKCGLVQYYESGTQKKYSAQNPEVLMQLLKDKKDQLKEAEYQTVHYVSHLKKQLHTPSAQAFASFYDGDDGIAVILRDVLTTVTALEEKKYEVISSKYVREYLYNNFPNFTRQRIKHGLYVRVIAIGEGGAAVEQSNRKWLAPEIGTAPNCYTIIYGEKTAFISLDERNVPQGIVLNNAGVTALQRTTFEQLWSSL